MEPAFATVLIDPNTLCREGLALILSTTRFCPMARLPTVQHLEETPLPPDGDLLVLADLGPQVEVAAGLVQTLKARLPACRLVVLTGDYDPPYMWAVMRAGANGLLIKTMPADALVKSLDLVALGEPVFPVAMLDTIFSEASGRPSPWSGRALTSRPLSGREAGILGHLARGDSNKLIARKLDIAEATVKVHVKAILRKIQVKNRTQAAVWALDQGPLARGPDETGPG